MKVSELIEELEQLSPDLRVMYPGRARDHDVAFVGVEDDVVLVSSEEESPGVEARQETAPPAPEQFDQEKALALLVVVHEAYALLARASYVAWLLSGDTGHANEWEIQARVLMRTIRKMGAAPPPKADMEKRRELLKNALSTGEIIFPK